MRTHRRTFRVCLWGLTAEANKAIFVAAIDESSFASAAGAIIDDGLHDNPFTNLHIMHAFSDLFYDSAKLVAHGQGYFLLGDGMRRGRHYVRPSEILVQVYQGLQSFPFTPLQTSRTCATNANIGGSDLGLGWRDARQYGMYGHTHLNLILTTLWYLNVLQANVVLAVVSQCFHHLGSTVANYELTETVLPKQESVNRNYVHLRLCNPDWGE